MKWFNKCVPFPRYYILVDALPLFSLFFFFYTAVNNKNQLFFLVSLPKFHSGKQCLVALI